MNITITGRIPSKKNSKQIVYVRGRPLIIESKQHREWFKQAKLQVESQGYIGIDTLQTGRKIEFKLFAPDARKGDLSNKFESVADLLVACKVLEDDNWSILQHVTMEFGGIDRESPRAEILIQPI